MSNEELLTTMFAVHGKRAMDAQFNEYLKIFDKLGNAKAEKVLKYVRDEEDKFPTIKQLWGIIHSLGLIEKKQSQLESFDDCFYCSGVGYVPRLISPKQDKRVKTYTTVVYACKCSAGDSVPQDMLRYFDTFGKLQFDEDFGTMQYPQFVSIKQLEYNKQLQKENAYATHERGKRQHRKKLEATELKKKIDAITADDIGDEIR